MSLNQQVVVRHMDALIENYRNGNPDASRWDIMDYVLAAIMEFIATNDVEDDVPRSPAYWWTKLYTAFRLIN